MAPGEEVFCEVAKQVTEVFIVVLLAEAEEIPNNKPFVAASWMRGCWWDVEVEVHGLLEGFGGDVPIFQ